MFGELTEAIANRQSIAKDVFSTKDLDRTEILLHLQKQLQDLRIADIVGDKGLQGSDIGKLSLAGGGIAALGTVIAFATQLVVLDITGGIIALVGAGLIAVTLIWKRSSILRDFSEKINKSREEFRERLDREISRIFENLFMEIEHRLKEPVSCLDEKTNRLANLVKEAERVNELVQSMK
jgi:hypothetical protein